MTHNELKTLKNWFYDYTQSFFSSDEEDNRNLSLKIIHTHNVCGNIIRIAKEEQLSHNEIILAESSALFHDIGRFEQYRKYKTFNDGVSINHGRLGSAVLQNEKILKNLPSGEEDLIIHTVKFHNAFAIPEIADPKKIFFLKLVRDADKLDVWRVFTEYYESSADERASVASHGLPDLPEYSANILSCVFNKKMASFLDVKTLNDFRLLHLSWVYDLNFKASFRLLLERDYIRKIITYFPQTDEIKAASRVLYKFLETRLNPHN